MLCFAEICMIPMWGTPEFATYVSYRTAQRNALVYVRLPRAVGSIMTYPTGLGQRDP